MVSTLALLVVLDAVASLKYGYLPRVMRPMLPTETVKIFGAAIGADRIVAGTDFPADMSDVDPVRTVESLSELSRNDRDMILRGNAARLLKLDV